MIGEGLEPLPEEYSSRSAPLLPCRNYATGVCRPSITSKTIHGSRAMRASSTRAGPVGCRRPCSQFRSVFTGTPIEFAKLCCEVPIPPRVLSRRARTSMNPRGGVATRGIPGRRGRSNWLANPNCFRVTAFHLNVCLRIVFCCASGFIQYPGQKAHTAPR